MATAKVTTSAASATTLRDIQPDERDRERRFRRDLLSIRSRLADAKASGADSRKIQDLTSELETKRLEFEECRVWLYTSRPRLPLLRGEMKPVELTEAGELIAGNKWALISYLVSDAETTAFVVTKGRDGKPLLRTHTIPIKGRDLGTLIESFRMRIARGELDLGADALKLGELLLKPAEAQLRGKTNVKAPARLGRAVPAVQ